ncbi:MAG: hypothetical protein WCG90_08410 [Chitinophagia bacterium]
MSEIIPKEFYSMNKSDQHSFAIREMQKHYALGDFWRRKSVQADKNKIEEPNTLKDKNGETNQSFQ